MASSPDSLHEEIGRNGNGIAEDAGNNGAGTKGDVADDGPGHATLSNIKALKEKELEKMAKIEAEYKCIKEKLHNARLQKIEESLNRLREGTLADYHNGVLKIKEATRKRKIVLAHQRRLDEINVNHWKACEMYSAECSLREGKRLLRQKIKERLLMKKYRLRKDKEQMETAIPAAFYTARPPKRKVLKRPKALPTHKPVPPVVEPLQKQNSSPQKGGRSSLPSSSSATHHQPTTSSTKTKHRRKIVVSSPCVIYMLHDSDIADDLRLFKKYH